MDMPSPRQPAHEEIQAIERFRKNVDKLLMHNQCIINAYALLKARFFVKI